MVFVIGILMLLESMVNLSGACPDGWVGHEGMCNHFSNEVEDWPGAKIMCEAMSGQLVEIENARENFFLGQQTKLNNHKIHYCGLESVIACFYLSDAPRFVENLQEPL
ncbi:C-type lectin (CTL) or carbohydrate-recognition domain (CRD) [Mactra antiquata]